ncbi:MAG: hypothetical protein ACPGLV_00480 [Bacteroidia bacterium]
MHITFTDKMNLAKNNLSKLIPKPLRIISMDEVVREEKDQKWTNYLGVTREEDHTIMIGLNEKYPEFQESVFIHEILHRILEQEGFPQIHLNHSKLKNYQPKVHWLFYYLSGRLSEILDHPTIYLRMEDEYNLNLTSYFDFHASKILNEIDDLHLKGDDFNSKVNSLFFAIEIDYYHEPWATETLEYIFEKFPFVKMDIEHLLRRLEAYDVNKVDSCKARAKFILTYFKKILVKENTEFREGLSGLTLYGNGKNSKKL